MKKTFRLTVNGVERGVMADPETPLLLVLRNDLNLRGTRFGCGQGSCGACFVHVDGAVVSSCDTPTWSVEGKSVVTVEGLGEGDALHRVQTALLEAQAAQCGYCVSGVLMTAAALLERHPRPDAQAIVEALDRHLCRCGVQRRIVRAVVSAAAADA